MTQSPDLGLGCREPEPGNPPLSLETIPANHPTDPWDLTRRYTLNTWAPTKPPLAPACTTAACDEQLNVSLRNISTDRAGRVYFLSDDYVLWLRDFGCTLEGIQFGLPTSDKADYHADFSAVSADGRTMYGAAQDALWAVDLGGWPVRSPSPFAEPRAAPDWTTWLCARRWAHGRASRGAAHPSAARLRGLRHALHR